MTAAEMLSIDATAGMLSADAIFGRQPALVPWPSSRGVLALVVEVLSTIENELTVDLVECLVRERQGAGFLRARTQENRRKR